MTQIVKLNVTQTQAPAPATLQQSGALISQGATVTSPNVASLLTQLSDLTPLLVGSKSITGIVQTTGLATATCAVAHGFTVGDTLLLTVVGSTVLAYNGTFLCTVTTGTAFTYAVPSGTASPATGTIAYTPEDVAELVSMATTFFANGSTQAVSVLELGPGNAVDGVAALTAYITANPNSDYTPGAQGYFYSYLVPREWDGVSQFIAMLANFNSTTSKTYFFVTTTLQNYALYTNLMKCVYRRIESPVMQVYAGVAFTALAYSGGLVTGTTASAHGITPGTWFQTAGSSPSGYNGWFLAAAGTTGSTLIWAVGSALGAETALGSVVTSAYANAGVPPTEFSSAAMFWVTLHYAPTAVNKVPPTSYSIMTGVTPFPTRGLSALLATLKLAFVNVVGTGAEGGISNTIELYGTTADGKQFQYWYSVDWVEINLDVTLSNTVINGSNNPINPLYYDQPGINRLLASALAVMKNAVTFGLALGPVTVTAIPFVDYIEENPSDYEAGIYGGIAVSYTPQKGFIQIIVNVNVSGFPTIGAG